MISTRDKLTVGLWLVFLAFVALAIGFHVVNVQQSIDSNPDINSSAVQSAVGLNNLTVARFDLVQGNFEQSWRALFVKDMAFGSDQYDQIGQPWRLGVGPPSQEVCDRAESDGVEVTGCSPVSTGMTEYLGCSGVASSFSMSWWSTIDSRPADAFLVEQLSGSTWVPYFEGNSTCVMYSTSIMKRFRIRASNVYGESPWAELTLFPEDCSGGGGPQPD